jgi:hypothetical protein
MAVRDMMALAKARNLPASDALDKLMEIIGPVVQDISRGMETSIVELGEMLKSAFFQWYTLARRIQMLGSDAVTEEDIDYEPGSLVPAHLPGEDAAKVSATPIWQRRKWHQNNFMFHLTPYSLHQLTQTSRKLILLQLQKAGFPMDPWTIAEAFDLNNFGPAPEGTITGMERWLAWIHLQRELQQEQQEALAMAAPMGPGQGKGGGRPPSYTAPPQLTMKDGGQRATIRTSPK